jgi:hypothetical protein
MASETSRTTAGSKSSSVNGQRRGRAHSANLRRSCSARQRQLLGAIAVDPLPWEAFEHLGREAEVVASVLQAEFAGRESFYGPPGLAATLAARTGARLARWPRPTRKVTSRLAERPPCGMRYLALTERARRHRLRPAG